MIDMRHFVSFPPAWGRRRVDEARVALYSGVVGGIFMAFPKVLDSYPTVLGGSQGAWLLGTLMMAAATAHVMALWINGSNPPLSRLIRMLACIGHASILLTFLTVFIMVGSYWGAASMGLVLSLLYSAMYRVAFPEAK